MQDGKHRVTSFGALWREQGGRGRRATYLSLPVHQDDLLPVHSDDTGYRDPLVTGPLHSVNVVAKEW